MSSPKGPTFCFLNYFKKQKGGLFGPNCTGMAMHGDAVLVVIFLISCCSRRTPKWGVCSRTPLFAAGGRATLGSLDIRSRGAGLSCHVRWHMRGGMRVPYHARASQHRKQRSRFGHWPSARHALRKITLHARTQMVVSAFHFGLILAIGCVWLSFARSRARRAPSGAEAELRE